MFVCACVCVGVCVCPCFPNLLEPSCSGSGENMVSEREQSQITVKTKTSDDSVH